MPKISEKTILFILISIIMILIHIGCGFAKGQGGNSNAMTALVIYSDIKSDDDRITMLRKEVFEALKEIIKEMAQAQVPVNSVFDSISGLNPAQVEFVKRAVRKHIKNPATATDPKVILVKDMADVIERILNDYYSDGLSDIIPTWRR